jgi:hypothetical protein
MAQMTTLRSVNYRLKWLTYRQFVHFYRTDTTPIFECKQGLNLEADSTNLGSGR